MIVVTQGATTANRKSPMEYIHMMGSFYEVIEGKLYYIPSLDTNPPTPDFKNYGLVTDVTADGINNDLYVDGLF